jgi:hypothetical protein
VKGKIGIWSKKLTEKGVSSFKRDIVVFAFFLLLSFIFWYLNSLRKDIETDIRYPVRYINPPEGRVIANELPPKLTLNVKGPGYSIIKLKISGNRAPVIIDFSKITCKRIPDTGQSEYFIVSSGLIQNFKKQLKPDFQIISIKPDTLFVIFEKKTNTPSNDKSSAGTGKGTRYLISQRLLSSDLEFITEKKRK